MRSKSSQSKRNERKSENAGSDALEPRVDIAITRWTKLVVG